MRRSSPRGAVRPGILRDEDRGRFSPGSRRGKNDTGDPLFSNERMFVVKKLIALLIIAGFFVITFAGCPSPTTSGSKPSTTGSTGAGATAKP